ncbi:MAG: glycyl-radical enzyme activating protein [Bacteroidales bacterium]|nr:glycyl-radical enzyme activating protein [Bacteroidales bacterium]
MIPILLTVFNIQRFCLHDGLGVRTNIFFKGCPLRCLWCNNPESIDPFPSIMFDSRLCHKFGDCIKNSGGSIRPEGDGLVIDRENITCFDALRDICPSRALTITGENMSINSIMSEIEKDIPFYEMSGGGVTLSGGEPFAQDGELIELLAELKKKDIHISAETSLHVPWENIEKCLGLVDVFLADLKHTDPEKFSFFTGGNAGLVMENFRKLDASGAQFVIRVPVVPDFNFSEPEIRSIIDFASDLNNSSEIHFIPFHSLAKEKYLFLGKDYVFGNARNVEKSEIAPCVEYAEHKGLTAKIMN